MKKLSQNLLQFDTKMASLGRLKLPTVCLEGRCSIQLSYGSINQYDGAEEENRTPHALGFN